MAHLEMHCVIWVILVHVASRQPLILMRLTNSEVCTFGDVSSDAFGNRDQSAYETTDLPQKTAENNFWPNCTPE